MFDIARIKCIFKGYLPLKESIWEILWRNPLAGMDELVSVFIHVPCSSYLGPLPGCPLACSLEGGSAEGVLVGTTAVGRSKRV